MTLILKDLRLGKVDGKHEYLSPPGQREVLEYDTFLLPESVDPVRLNNADMFFIEGFRGTGKTSLLRWHAIQQSTKGSVTDFILFKSDLSEEQRLHISKEVGISWTDVDPKVMEISQDFKSAWTWFILHKIGESIRAASQTSGEGEKTRNKFVRLLGLEDETVFRKAIGFLPQLEGSYINVKADLEFFEIELGGDFTRNKTTGKTTLDALVRRAISVLSAVKLERPLYIYFDELEAFYHTPEQHKRDQRMVRDLLFSIGHLNDRFRIAQLPIHLIGAVRSEIIDSMGSLGQEVDRLVHDKGFLISWHHSKRSVKHPLIEIIVRKIQASEIASGIKPSTDPIEKYFPQNVDGVQIEAFLLDKSFYKPRDIVWRLSLAQKLFPNETQFSSVVLHNTETEYSGKLWDEVRYELSATYSDDEISGIEQILSGNTRVFEMHQIEDRFNTVAQRSTLISKLLKRRSVQEIMSDLYRLGAIGNAFRIGPNGDQIRNRWVFRGDAVLLIDKSMQIHAALYKRLSIIAPRRRGVRGGRNRKSH